MDWEVKNTLKEAAKEIKYRQPVDIDSLLQKKKRKNRPLLLIAISILLTMGSGFVSPTMASTLSALPFIGPIYAKFDDLAAEQIQNKKLATSVEKTDQHDGLSMHVKEAVYDGGRLVLTVEYKGSDISISDESKVGMTMILLNGEEPRAAAGSIGQRNIDRDTIIESHEFTLEQYNELGDEVSVTVQGRNLFGKKGTWDVSFPLKKIDGQVREFPLTASAKTKDSLHQLTLNHIRFSPLSTRIDMTYDYPNEMKENYPAFRYTVKTDTGKIYEGVELQIGSVGMDGHHIVLNLPPMEQPPKSITILPFYDGGSMFQHGIVEDLQITASLK